MLIFKVCTASYLHFTKNPLVPIREDVSALKKYNGRVLGIIKGKKENTEKEFNFSTKYLSITSQTGYPGMKNEDSSFFLIRVLRLNWNVPSSQF